MTLDRDYLQQFDEFSIERFLLEEADLGELEREVAIAFETQTGREQFVYMPLALGHSELLTAYHWICDQRVIDKGRLKEPVTDISKSMIAEYQRKGKLSPYQLGNAFITLLEMQNGPSVSADILNGRFSRTKI